MTAGLRWTAGVVASLGVHAAAGAALWVWIQPEDVPVQPMPETEVEVVAHTLDRTEARATPPEATPAAEAAATGDNIDTGAIPTSRAAPASLPSQQVADAEPAIDRAKGIDPGADPLPDARPQTAAVPATEAAAQTVASADPTAPEKMAAVSPNPSAVASAVPQGRKAAGVAPPGSRVNAVAVPSTAAPAASNVAASVPSFEPQPEGLSAVTEPALVAATTAAIVSATVPSAKPSVRPLSAGRPPVQVAALKVPSAEPASKVVTDAPAAVALAPPSAPVAPADPPAEAAAAAQPPAEASPAIAPKAETSPQSDPDIRPAAYVAPPSRPVEPAAPDADTVKAALAFPGGDGPVDPLSFAAFQSFMQPGDLTAGNDPVRDGVAGLLAQVPCSRLQVGFDPETTTLVVNGHIPQDGLRSDVLSALQAQMGADIAVSDNMLVLPRPQCNALSGIAAVGLPQSTDQFTNPLVIGEDAHARVFGFVKGDFLSLDMTAPDYDAVIYLDYFDAAGNVLHLEPNEYSPLREAPAKTAQRIGAKSAEDKGLRLIIGPPYGQEIAVAFAASHPLYDGLRPIQEPAAGYLEWLRSRVEAAREEHPDFKGEWVYFFVSTSEG